jgi:hypothetical protein
MTVTFHELRSLDLDEREMDVYDKPIGIRRLFEDPVSGAEHHLIRYPEGMKGRRHRHSVAHTILVLDGAIEIDGELLGPGGYAHHPANAPMLHQPAPGQGTLFVIMFDGPFDVTIVDD